MRAEQLLTVSANLGEGPVWDEINQEIVWVDILAGSIHRVSIDGVRGPSVTLSFPVGAVAPTMNGSWVAATPRGLESITHGSLIGEIPQIRKNLRMNDGKSDPVGRFVGGTMSMGSPQEQEKAGTLWSIEGSKVMPLVEGTTISNGLDWSSDGRTLFYIDTPTQRIDAFDYEVTTGEVSNRRTWASIPFEMGSPDGMCIDTDNRLWVALWGGGAVICLVDGLIVERIEVPTPQVTCPVFAGPKLDQLVITTAAMGLDAHSSGAGDLYICSPGTTGNLPNALGAWAH